MRIAAIRVFERQRACSELRGRARIVDNGPNRGIKRAERDGRRLVDAGDREGQRQMQRVAAGLDIEVDGVESDWPAARKLNLLLS
jgi:hypothetical protein